MKLKDLASQRRVVEGELAELQKELQALDFLINRQRKRDGLPEDLSLAAAGVSENGTGEKQRRTRGTLKAAKTAATELPEFTRSELFERIEVNSPNLAGKIKAEAQRSTIRTLIEMDFIEVTDREIEGETVYKSLKLRQ